MIYPLELEKIISFYKKLPGIGEKSAERLALATLDFKEEDLEEISSELIMVKEKLKPCVVCGHITNEEKCNICNDKTRNQNLICIIEDYKSVFAFEKAGNYKGLYHVLGGLISPIEDVGPEDINIASLIERVKNKKNIELVLALKSSIEGETTMLYINKIFEGMDVTVSRLSYGIPIGAEIDYLDVITLDKALEDRKKIS